MCKKNVNKVLTVYKRGFAVARRERSEVVRFWDVCYAVLCGDMAGMGFCGDLVPRRSATWTLFDWDVSGFGHG